MFSGRLTAVRLCPHVRRWSRVCQMNISRHTVMLNTPSDAWRLTWGPGNSVMSSFSPETAGYRHTGTKKTVHMIQMIHTTKPNVEPNGLNRTNFSPMTSFSPVLGLWHKIWVDPVHAAESQMPWRCWRWVMVVTFYCWM